MKKNEEKINNLRYFSQKSEKKIQNFNINSQNYEAKVETLSFCLFHFIFAKKSSQTFSFFSFSCGNGLLYINYFDIIETSNLRVSLGFLIISL